VIREDKSNVEKTPRGKAVEFGEEGSNMIKTLKPGATLSEVGIINEIFDMSKPGKY
jgi:hypothetical protein